MISQLLLLTTTLASSSGGYLFVTFKGEQTPMTEQIYFAVSKDGRTWNALKGGEPVLVSQLGEKGLRDPYVLRSHDGKKFFLIATDLSINLNGDWGRAVRAGSKNIVIWESRDLVKWSTPRLVKVAPDDAGCTWAPEAIYDEDTKDYLVFWASTTKRDDFSKHRIWAARTEDFRKFGEPFIYIEKPTTVIDTTIIREGEQYFRFTKDEKFKAITMESSTKIAGPWKEVENFSLSQLRGYEGPQVYRVDNGWCLILDFYSQGKGYQPFETQDLKGGQFKPGAGFSFPFRFRHGSVLPISNTEYDRLERSLGEQPKSKG